MCGSKYLHAVSKSNKISCLLTFINVIATKYTMVHISYLDPIKK